MRGLFSVFAFVGMIAFSFFYSLIVAILKKLRKDKVKTDRVETINALFNKNIERVLLDLARISLIYYIENGKYFTSDEFIKLHLNPKDIASIQIFAGVFVTIKKKGELRGCIGILKSTRLITENINKYVVQAALKDPRFPPVTLDEIEELTFEISIIGKMKKVKSVNEIKLGKHGVVFELGDKSAVFLPQVANEFIMNKIEFLEQLSIKADLTKDAYKHKDASFKVFKVRSFNEEDFYLRIKKPDFAGKFYPKEHKELKSILNDYLNNVVDEPLNVNSIKGVIVPHAGYIYSGKIAGHAYRQFARNENIKYIVIFCISHNYNFSGIAYSDYNVFETPVGNISTDHELLDLIIDCEGLFKSDTYFVEHSLETQLPFIRKAFERNVRILPLVVGTGENIPKIMKILWNKKEIGFVFSTDLSHYLNTDECKKEDKKTIKAIENLNGDLLNPDMLCGYEAIKGLLDFAKNNKLIIKNISYGNSANITNENTAVGYGSFVIMNNTNIVF